MASTNNTTKQLISTTVAVFCMVTSSLATAEEKSSIFDRQKLTFFVEAGYEHDDNITVSVLDRTTGKSDNALVVDFSTSYMLLKEEAQELELTYDFYQSLHEHLDEFDLQIHTLSALSSWEVKGIDVGLDYSYSKILLDRTSLYKYHTLTPSLGISWLGNQYLRVSYSYQDKDFASTTRDAKQHSVSADNYYFFMDSRAYVSLGIRLEAENTIDPELDYKAAYLKLGASVPLPYADVKLKANYEHYWRDYDNDTASIGQNRDDEQDLISIDLIKPVSENLSVKLNYEHTNIDSNLASIDTVENRVTLSFMAEF